MNLMNCCFIIKKSFSVISGTLLSNIKLKLWGCKTAGLVKSFGVPYIEKSPLGTIKIGRKVCLRSSFVSNVAGCFHPVILATLKSGKITIGDNCGISSSVLVSESSVTIGKNVLIGVNCVISDTDFHSVSYLDRRNIADDKRLHKTTPVVIEDDVWLGMNVTVLKGVTIGKGSVIAAGSVVTKDISEYSLAGGNPAVVLKKLEL